MRAVAGALLLIAMVIGQFGFHLHETGPGLFAMAVFGILGGALVSTGIFRS